MVTPDRERSEGHLVGFGTALFTSLRTSEGAENQMFQQQFVSYTLFIEIADALDLDSVLTLAELSTQAAPLMSWELLDLT